MACEASAPQDGPAAEEQPAEAAARLRREIGDSPCVCILGGTAFYKAGSEELVTAVARQLAQRVGPRAVIVTGGMPGVQKAFAEAFAEQCSDGTRLFQLVPQGQQNPYGVGEALHAGANLEQRRDAFGLLGDIYLTVEGGPGVAAEARAAVARGARVLPLMRTGGASAGMYEFPAEALARPPNVSAEHWVAIHSSDAPVLEASAAVVAVLDSFIADCDERHGQVPISVDQLAEGASSEAHTALAHNFFDGADEDDDGVLDPDELANVLRRIHSDITREESQQRFQDLDVDANGVIDFEEFCVWFSKTGLLFKLATTSDMLRALFHAIDRDANGKISLQDLLQAFDKLNTPTPSEVEAIFSEMDKDGSGSIDFDEFMDGQEADLMKLVAALIFRKKAPTSPTRGVLLSL